MKLTPSFRSDDDGRLTLGFRTGTPLTATGEVLALISGNSYSELWHPGESTVWTERTSPTTVAGDGDLVGTIQGLNGVSNLIAPTDADRTTLTDAAGQWSFTCANKKLGDTDGTAKWNNSVTLRIYVAVTIADTKAVIVHKGSTTAPFFGLFTSASTAASASVAYGGSYVDNVEVSPDQRGQLYTDLNGGTKLFELRGLDATGSDLADIGFFAYAGTTFLYNGTIGPLLVIEEALADAAGDATIRAMFQEWGTT